MNEIEKLVNDFISEANRIVSNNVIMPSGKPGTILYMRDKIALFGDQIKVVDREVTDSANAILSAFKSASPAEIEELKSRLKEEGMKAIINFKKEYFG